MLPSCRVSIGTPCRHGALPGALDPAIGVDTRSKRQGAGAFFMGVGTSHSATLSRKPCPEETMMSSELAIRHQVPAIECDGEGVAVLCEFDADILFVGRSVMIRHIDVLTS
jgi:hypothetical protein